MNIRIYVACLAAYNNGILHGRWVDAGQGVEAMWEGIREMLAASPIADAEEWAIHDHEGFEGAHIAEYEGIQDVADMAAFIEEHGKLGSELLAYCNDINDARKAIEEDCRGEYASLADFAQSLTEETFEVPKHLADYIDYERMGRDLEMGDVFAIETGFEQVHVFWCQ